VKPFGALVPVVVILACGSAWAQPQQTQQVEPGGGGGFIAKDVAELDIDKCAPDTNVTKAEHLRRGEEYYNRGEVLYAQGDYKGAVSELVASYCEVPYYGTLKDIAQAWERELEYGKALAYFSRFVLQVPPDAKKANDCATDPQADKSNVLARITVLEKLPAKIRVQATPEDAQVNIIQSNVVKAFGTKGSEMEVKGGPYQLVVKRAGYVTKTQDIHPEVGKPYTYVVELDPVKGRLHLSVIPGDGRIFIDKRLAGTGIVETEVKAGRYSIQVEAQDRQTEVRDVEVLPDKDTTLTFELKSPPQIGRRQLLFYGSLAGLVAGFSLVDGQHTDNKGLAGGAALGGLAAGFFTVYYGTSANVPLGTSSLTITSSLIGGTIGAALGTGIDNKPPSDSHLAPALGGAGLLVGAGTGYYFGQKSHLTPGDAAVINSGALWGTVAGSLFALSFNAGPEIGAGLVLSGVGMGTLGGVLLQRFFTVSRPRAALIDASGIVGMVLGLAAENLVEQAFDVTTPRTSERTANYALGGLATGLILGGVLTRSIDEPKLPVTPVFQKSKGANGAEVTTFGIATTF
jgi:hypothetical protein